MKLEVIKTVLAILLFLAGYRACTSLLEPLPTPEFALYQSGLKTLSNNIKEANFSTVSGEVTLHLAVDPLTGGAQDWNGIANTTHHLSEAILSKPPVRTITLVWWTTGEDPIDWARVIIERGNLPKDWQELTYLQFFSHLKKLPGTVDSGTRLCEFYAKYDSARPNATLPDFCKTAN